MHDAVKKQFGLLDPQYKYLLNPYPEMKFSSCPLCKSKTGQRKLPLVIHVDPKHLISLSYTHRYCKKCDALIGHKHEIERILFDIFSKANPYAIGNRYVIVGTMEKEFWREGLTQPQEIAKALPHVRDLNSFEELRMTMAGWFHKDQEPPVMTPPESTEWTRRKP
jgi:hypothetical protein